ncbi:hypothetical protein E2C01_070984 [Portunus trituberculatus]|uniref:Uncharacterized protein n=1 Tax=Portunus trituberculatus TaxID=210409 RepID=A0A5B7I6T0_PORTR|nr:hypothetical protein [Portunus trituberculatus]
MVVTPYQEATFPRKKKINISWKLPPTCTSVTWKQNDAVHEDMMTNSLIWERKTIYCRGFNFTAVCFAQR